MQLVFFSVSLRSVSYNLGHAAIQVALALEEGWWWWWWWGGGGGWVHDKLCKVFWRVNIFSAPGMGRVSSKLVGQNKNALALPSNL